MVSPYSPAVPNLILLPTPWADLLIDPGPMGMLSSALDAPYGPSLVFSDGTRPRQVGRGIQYAELTSIIAGEVTYTYAQPYPTGKPPIVISAIAIIAAAAQPIDVSIKTSTLSETSVTFLLKQAGLAVLGLAIFANAPSGTIIHATVGPRG